MSRALCPPVLHMWQPRRSPPLGTGHSASPGASIGALARGRRGPAAVTPPTLPSPAAAGWPAPPPPQPPPSPPCDSRSSHSLVVDPACCNGRHVQIEANGKQSHSGGPVRGRPLAQRGPGGREQACSGPAVRRAWSRGGQAASHSSRSTRLLFCRLTAPRAQAPASTVDSAPWVTATGRASVSPGG